jgi:hypothetical protein
LLRVSSGRLPVETNRKLREAQQRLWAVIANTRELRASELWSWRYVDGRYQVAPFGQNSGDADESNAAQLWSTVYLAIPPPAEPAASRSQLENLLRLLADREHRGMLDVALHGDGVELAPHFARGAELLQP